MAMLLGVVICVRVHVRNTTIPGYPPVYWFSNETETDNSYFVDLNERPHMSLARRVDSVWHIVLERNGWAIDQKKARFTIRHHLLPADKFFDHLGPGLYVSQLPAWHTFEKDNQVRYMRRQMAECTARGCRNDYSHILPETYILPDEARQLKQAMNASGGAYFIAKATYGSLGSGIKLTKSYEEVNTSKRQVVSRYVDNPLTFRGYKFDLRVWALIASIDPFVLYVYEDGYVKLASRRYEQPTEENKHMHDMHLNNRGPNLKNYYARPCWLEQDLLGFQELRDVFSYVYNSAPHVLERAGLDALNATEFDTEMRRRLQKALQLYFVALYPELLNGSLRWERLIHAIPRQIYARYGLDVMLTDRLEFVVIECNRRPFQQMLCPVEQEVAPVLIADELNLVGVPLQLDKMGRLIQNEWGSAPAAENNSDDLFQPFFGVEQLFSDKLRWWEEIARCGSVAFTDLTDYERFAIVLFIDQQQRAGRFKLVFPTAETELYKELRQTTHMNDLLHLFVSGRINGVPPVGSSEWAHMFDSLYIHASQRPAVPLPTRDEL